jgi:hypothetical protein
MKSTSRFVAILLSLVFGIAYAQVPEAEIQTRSTSTVNYAWIAFLSEAPAVWVSDVPVKGQFVRLVVYSPVEEDPSIFRVETVTYGDEGCCRKLVRARTFKPEKVMLDQFGPFNKKDNVEFEFVRWLSPTSVEIKYYGSAFILTNLDRNVLRVKRVR